MDSISFWIGLTVVLLGGAFLLGLLLRRQRQKALARVAEDEHWEFEESPEGGRIEGKRRGQRFVVTEESHTGSDGGLAGLDTITIKLDMAPGYPEGLRIERSGALVEALREEESIATGSPEFDEEFHVSAREPDQVVAYLDLVRRRALLDLIKEDPSANVTLIDGTLQLSERRLLGDSEWVKAKVDRMARVASSFEQDRR